MIFGVVCICLALVASMPAFAQSGLGISSASVGSGFAEDESGTQRFAFASSLDVMVTPYHGLQGDLAFTDTQAGTVGSLVGHGYLTTNFDRKYGLFASLSDLDGRSLSWVTVGAEAMYDLNPATTIEGRLGLGVADSQSMDFIFGGASAYFDFGSELQLEISLNVADFDESYFRATSVETEVVARYAPKRSFCTLFAGLRSSKHFGRDGSDANIGTVFGATIELGNRAGVRPMARSFRDYDPMLQLVRRGLM